MEDDGLSAMMVLLLKQMHLQNEVVVLFAVAMVRKWDRDRNNETRVRVLQRGWRARIFGDGRRREIEMSGAVGYGRRPLTGSRGRYVWLDDSDY